MKCLELYQLTENSTMHSCIGWLDFDSFNVVQTLVHPIHMCTIETLSTYCLIVLLFLMLKEVLNVNSNCIYKENLPMGLQVGDSFLWTSLQEHIPGSSISLGYGLLTQTAVSFFYFFECFSNFFFRVLRFAPTKLLSTFLSQNFGNFSKMALSTHFF